MRFVLLLLLLGLVACQNPLQEKVQTPQGGPTPEEAVVDWVMVTQKLERSQIEVLAISPVGQTVLVAYDYPKADQTQHALAVTSIDQGRSTAAGSPVWSVGQAIETSSEDRVADLLTFYRGGLRIGSDNVFVVWGRALDPQVGRIGIVANDIGFETPLLLKGFVITVPVLGQPVATLSKVEARNAAGQPLAAWEAP